MTALGTAVSILERQYMGRHYFKVYIATMIPPVAWPNYRFWGKEGTDISRIYVVHSSSFSSKCFAETVQWWISAPS